MKYQFLWKSYLILGKIYLLKSNLLKTVLIFVKNQEIEIDYIMSPKKSNLSKTHRKSSKPGWTWENLVLITWTVQVELSKLSFNFDDIITYFLQVLRDCWHITFIRLNGFRRLSKKTHVPLSNGQYQDG